MGRWNRRRRPLVLSIVGTRPEAIKMAPVVRALDEHPDLDQALVLTGQHPHLETSFDLPADAVHSLELNLKEQTAGEIRDSIHHALCPHLMLRRPDLVLVQGDTSSAMAGALAARDCAVPLGHVEAGLRSGDLLQPWPEEIHRIRIDALSDLLFAPTETAARNLAAEPLVKGVVHVTGNSGIDELLHARSACPPTPLVESRPVILATCHRRENQGAPLRRVARASKRLARELQIEIVYLLPMNPHLAETVRRLLWNHPGILLVEPLDHREMVCLIDRAWLILTDSGGLQEEGPALGKPVLVLRNTTERGEAVASDNIELVGTDPERIFAAVSLLMEDEARYAIMSRPSFPFGDGRAAPRIAGIVEDFLLAAAGPLTIVADEVTAGTSMETGAEAI